MRSATQAANLGANMERKGNLFLEFLWIIFAILIYTDYTRGRMIYIYVRTRCGIRADIVRFALSLDAWTGVFSFSR